MKITTKNNKEHPTIKKIYKEYIVPDTFIVEDVSNVDFKELLKIDDIIIDEFVGSFETTKSSLTDSVPVDFDNSEIIEIIDTVEVTRQKIWTEYANYIEDDNYGYVMIGCVDSRGNKKREATHDELMQWIDHFEENNILTKEETRAKYSEINGSVI